MEKKRKRRRTIKLAAAVIVLVLVIGFVGLYIENMPRHYGPGPIGLEVFTTESVYEVGEEVTFIIRVNNSQNWPVRYPNSIIGSVEGNGVQIQLPGSAIYDYPVNAPSYPANEVTIYNKIWNQTYYHNGTYTPVDAGNYTFTYSTSGFGYDTSANCTFEIRQKGNSGPIEITIAPDKPYFRQGEEVTLTGNVTNTLNQPVPHPSLMETNVKMIEGAHQKGNVNNDDLRCGEYITYDVNNVPTYPANTNSSFTWRWYESRSGDQTIPHEPGIYMLKYSIAGAGYDTSANCIFEIR